MARQDTPQPSLDHIVILVSHSTLQDLSSKLRDSFTIAPGGTHTNGVTSNKLILFQDGVYIELIAFADGADPGERKKHRWGLLREGQIIDWAYTLPSTTSDIEPIRQRVRDADAGITYDEPQPGGRTRPDGVELKWATVSARHDTGEPTWPGRLPFWCLDQTPRRLRVPYEGSDLNRHPCGARGVSRVSVTAPKSQVSALAQVYGAIHDGGAAGRSWPFVVPSGAGGAHSVSLSGGDQPPEIRLTLVGGKHSPSTVELVPGLIVDFEAAEA